MVVRRRTAVAKAATCAVQNLTPEEEKALLDDDLLLDAHQLATLRAVFALSGITWSPSFGYARRRFCANSP
jgi:hypothetical protein